MHKFIVEVFNGVVFFNYDDSFNGYIHHLFKSVLGNVLSSEDRLLLNVIINNANRHRNDRGSEFKVEVVTCLI